MLKMIGSASTGSGGWTGASHAGLFERKARTTLTRDQILASRRAWAAEHRRQNLEEVREADRLRKRAQRARARARMAE